MAKGLKPNRVQTNKNVIENIDFARHIKEFARFKRFIYFVLIVILIIILLLGLRFKPRAVPRYTTLGRLLKQQGTQIILQEGALVDNNLCVYDEHKGLDCSLDPSSLNTDSQKLSLLQNVLSISNGNSVVFNGWDTNVFDDVKYLTQLLDVAVTSSAQHEVLKFDGNKWINELLNFVELEDTPSGYSPLSLLRVDPTGDSIEYVDFDDLSYWKRQANVLSPRNSGDNVALESGESLYINDLAKGGILFASDQGLVTSNSKELYWDEATERMGLGVQTPKAKLHIDSVKLGEDKLLITGNNNTTFVTKIGIAGTEKLEKLTTTIRTPDGGVLMVGYILDTTTNKKDAYVIKMDITGNIDTNFGINGSLVFKSATGQNDEFLTGLLSKKGDAYFLAGRYADKKGFVVKLKLDGSLDTAFANNGVFIFDIEGYASVVDIADVYSPFFKPPLNDVYLLVESDVSRRVHVVKLNGDTGKLNTSFKGGIVTIDAVSVPSGRVVPKKLLVDFNVGVYVLVDLTGDYASDKVSDIGIFGLYASDGTPLANWANTTDPDYLVLDTGEADYVLGGFLVGGARASDIVIIGKQVSGGIERPIFIKLRDTRVGLFDSASFAAVSSSSTTYTFARVKASNSKLIPEAYIGGTDSTLGVLMKVVEDRTPGGVSFAWDKPIKRYDVYQGGIGSTAIFDVATSDRDADIVGMGDPDFTAFGIDDQGYINAPSTCFSQDAESVELRPLSVKPLTLKSNAYGGKLATHNLSPAQDSAGELIGICSQTTTGVALIVDEVGRVGVSTDSPSAAFQIGNPGDGTYGLANGWNSFSDARLKDDITTLEGKALSLINKLNPVKFRWKSSNKRDIGFIAQEVQQVFPDVVSEVDGLLTIDYDGFIPLLVKAIQELSQETKTNSLDFLEINDNNVAFNRKVIAPSLAATSIDASVIKAESILVSDKVLINSNGEVSLKELNTDTLSLSSKSKGVAVLPAGGTSITVRNNLVSEDTLVIVTSYAKDPVVFSVIRGDGYFEIKISSAVNTDIEFGWMVVR